ncbi:hypothetical protein Pyn_19051 [Prunus yedoensis var. nudiflora]|uniref:Uncharacterized protein n=1 Tax=Prunus yedoensis var. nudiflora TaxID=2094558 RepID=A0A314YKQ9_PRUYE|nr:hypothetical protein Pyn_19051 [Prunus yedoensis var. nudiflora]
MKSGDVEKIVENIEEKKDEMKSGDVEKIVENIEEKKDEMTSIFSLNRRLF